MVFTRYLPVVATVVIIVLLQVGAARADDLAVVSLGRPHVSGTIAEFPLTLEFETTSGEELVYFSLDVSASSGLLTEEGADFRAFSFTPASPLLDQFDPIPGSGFGIGNIASSVEYDTITTSLSPGIYALGRLAVDYSQSGLTAGDYSVLSLSAPRSMIGVEPPGNPSEFRFINLGFVLPPDTVPIDFIVADESDYLLNVVGGGSQSVEVPGRPENILGGERAVTLEFVSGSSQDALMSAKYDGEDVLIFSAANGARGALNLTYGQGRELNSDFLQDPTDPMNAILVDFARVTGQGLLTLRLDSNGIEQAYTTIVSAAGVIAAPYSNFPNIDFSTVDTVSVRLEGVTEAAEFTIREIVLGRIQQVPEPASGVIIAHAICLVAMVRSRLARRRL